MATTINTVKKSVTAFTTQEKPFFILSDKEVRKCCETLNKKLLAGISAYNSTCDARDALHSETDKAKIQNFTVLLHQLDLDWLEKARDVMVDLAFYEKHLGEGCVPAAKEFREVFQRVNAITALTERKLSKLAEQYPPDESWCTDDSCE